MLGNKIFFLIGCILFVFVDESFGKDGLIKNNESGAGKTTILASPNWVHPKLREKSEGYKRIKEQKQSSPMWKYSTNRPSGNIKGGGTTQYNDYTPFYNPSPKK